MKRCWTKEWIIKFKTPFHVIIFENTEKLCLAKLTAIRICWAHHLSTKLCIFAVFVCIITEALTDVNLVLSEPPVLVWATEVAHHVIEMIAAFITWGIKVWHSWECWCYFCSCTTGALSEPRAVGEAVWFFGGPIRTCKTNSVLRIHVECNDILPVESCCRHTTCTIT